MAHKTKFLAAAAVAALPNTVLAEGLERNNLDANFLFTEGSAAELSIGNVSPTLPATLPAALGGSKIDNVAGSFQIMTTSAKTSIGDNLDLGLWYTNQGNGVDIDWGTTIGIKAQVSLSTLAGLARYKLNENYSLIGGIKQVNVASGGEVNLSGTEWAMGSASATGTVIGVAYERPEVAARVVLTSEAAIDLKIPTKVNGVSGVDSVGGVGDAINLSFQTGIAPDTLLFGNFRSSNWADNQLTLSGAQHPSLLLKMATLGHLAWGVNYPTVFLSPRPIFLIQVMGMGSLSWPQQEGRAQSASAHGILYLMLQP